jgi:hypothetical protein
MAPRGKSGPDLGLRPDSASHPVAQLTTAWTRVRSQLVAMPAVSVRGGEQIMQVRQDKRLTCPGICPSGQSGEDPAGRIGQELLGEQPCFPPRHPAVLYYL